MASRPRRPRCRSLENATSAERHCLRGVAEESRRQGNYSIPFFYGRLDFPWMRTGRHRSKFHLNDSITSFRIVAVATGGTGLFGTGSTSIQSTQDLMILSGLPPLVREGDRFKAGFTLRNTTNRSMEVDVSGKVEGLSESLKPHGHSSAARRGEGDRMGWTVPYWC